MSVADKQVVFAAAGGPATPWGALGAITAAALAPHGYQVRLERDIRASDGPTLAQAGRLELGAANDTLTRWAYHGVNEFRDKGPAPRLRAIAAIMSPMWIGVATRFELGVNDLSQIRERRLPVRVMGGRGAMFDPVMAHYGLTREAIESWGGRFVPSHTNVAGHETPPAPFVRTGEVDLIVDNLCAAYSLEGWYWWEASILSNLRFHALPEELIARICRDLGGEPGFIPYRLLRGVTEPVRTVSRTRQVIFGHDDLPDDFVYLVARALDENRARFRHTHIAQSYDETAVADGGGIPLHPGAERYYREKRYLR